MARSTVGLNALTDYPELLAVAGLEDARPGTPLQSYVQEDTGLMSAGSSADILARLEESFLDADLAEPLVEDAVKSRLEEELAPLMEFGDSQIEILESLLADAGIETSVSTPSRDVYKVQVAELVRPAIQAVFDSVAACADRRTWRTSAEVLIYIQSAVDPAWSRLALGLPQDDQEVVLRHAADAVFELWSGGEVVELNHCDRWMRIAPGSERGSVDVVPTRPVLAGTYHDEPSSRSSADGPSSTLRLIPTTPTEFILARDLDNPAAIRLLARDLMTREEYASVPITEATKLARSKGSVILSVDHGIVQLAASERTHVRRLRGSLIVEVDASYDERFAASLEGHTAGVSIEDSADHQLVGVFGEVNPVHTEGRGGR